MFVQKLSNRLLRMAAVCLGAGMIWVSPGNVYAAEAPFPIAWQQGEADGAEAQRMKYLPWASSWYDYPWNRGTETGNTVGLAGCSLFSVINGVYYHTGQFIEPKILADFALEEGYRTPGVSGVLVEFFPAFSEAFGEEYGVEFVGDTKEAEEVLAHVRSGGTSSSNVYGHWITIADYDEENDLYLILDSAIHCQRCANIEWTDKENGIAWLTPEELLEEGKSGYYGIDQRHSALFVFEEHTFAAEPGDANGNGVVNISDATAVLTYYAQSAAALDPDVLHLHPEQNAVCLEAADMDGNGALDISDATAILELYAKRAAGLA